MSRAEQQSLELPEQLYLDTQFCFAYLVESDPDHEAAADLSIVLKQLCATNLATCHFSILALEELAWTVGGFLFDRDNGQGAWRRASKARAFHSVKDETAHVIRDFMAEEWISVLAVRDTVYSKACGWLLKYDLKPADLCHMVLASTVNAGIVSNDGDFHRIARPPVEVIGY
ncbi:MAG: PIN domain-containing protein [Armatimonadota bacterium]|jgi:predicted nucleic acid-binding protein